jgi:hypothetical protein
MADFHFDPRPADPFAAMEAKKEADMTIITKYFNPHTPTDVYVVYGAEYGNMYAHGSKCMYFVLAHSLLLHFVLFSAPYLTPFFAIPYTLFLH